MNTIDFQIVARWHFPQIRDHLSKLAKKINRTFTLKELISIYQIKT